MDSGMASVMASVHSPSQLLPVVLSVPHCVQAGSLAGGSLLKPLMGLRNCVWYYLH